MKCYRASPFGKFRCELEKGHEGPCYDGMHHFTENIDEIGRNIIFDINSKFRLDIPITNVSTSQMTEIVNEYLDELIGGTDYGYCPDCDERRGEPMINEGYL